MRSIFVVMTGMLFLGGCTTVPGAVADATRIVSTVVNSAAAVGSSALEGADHVLHNAANDVTATTNTAAAALTPPPAPF